MPVVASPAKLTTFTKTLDALAVAALDITTCVESVNELIVVFGGIPAPTTVSPTPPEEKVPVVAVSVVVPFVVQISCLPRPILKITPPFVDPTAVIVAALALVGVDPSK